MQQPLPTIHRSRCLDSLAECHILTACHCSSLSKSAILNEKTSWFNHRWIQDVVFVHPERSRSDKSAKQDNKENIVSNKFTMAGLYKAASWLCNSFSLLSAKKLENNWTKTTEHFTFSSEEKVKISLSNLLTSLAMLQSKQQGETWSTRNFLFFH